MKAGPTVGASAPLGALDRVLSMGPDDAVALRNVPNTLGLFDSHFPRFPVLPGVVLLATAAELGGLLLTERTGQTWRLSAARRVRFRSYVRPGDQVLVRVRVSQPHEARTCVEAVFEVGATTVASVNELEFKPMAGGR